MDLPRCFVLGRLVFLFAFVLVAHPVAEAYDVSLEFSGLLETDKTSSVMQGLHGDVGSVTVVACGFLWDDVDAANCLLLKQAFVDARSPPHPRGWSYVIDDLIDEDTACTKNSDTEIEIELGWSRDFIIEFDQEITFTVPQDATTTPGLVPDDITASFTITRGTCTFSPTNGDSNPSQRDVAYGGMEFDVELTNLLVEKPSSTLNTQLLTGFSGSFGILSSQSLDDEPHGWRAEVETLLTATTAELGSTSLTTSATKTGTTIPLTGAISNQLVFPGDVVAINCGGKVTPDVVTSVVSNSFEVLQSGDCTVDVDFLAASQLSIRASDEPSFSTDGVLSLDINNGLVADDLVMVWGMTESSGDCPAPADGDAYPLFFDRVAAVSDDGLSVTLASYTGGDVCVSASVIKIHRNLDWMPGESLDVAGAFTLTETTDSFSFSVGDSVVITDLPDCGDTPSIFGVVDAVDTDTGVVTLADSSQLDGCGEGQISLIKRGTRSIHVTVPVASSYASSAQEDLTYVVSSIASILEQETYCEGTVSIQAPSCDVSGVPSTMLEAIDETAISVVFSDAFIIMDPLDSSETDILIGADGGSGGFSSSSPASEETRGWEALVSPLLDSDAVTVTWQYVGTVKLGSPSTVEFDPATVSDYFRPGDVIYMELGVPCTGLGDAGEIYVEMVTEVVAGTSIELSMLSLEEDCGTVSIGWLSARFDRGYADDGVASLVASGTDGEFELNSAEQLFSTNAIVVMLGLGGDDCLADLTSKPVVDRVLSTTEGVVTLASWQGTCEGGQLIEIETEGTSNSGLYNFEDGYFQFFNTDKASEFQVGDLVAITDLENTPSSVCFNSAPRGALYRVTAVDATTLTVNDGNGGAVDCGGGYVKKVRVMTNALTITKPEVEEFVIASEEELSLTLPASVSTLPVDITCSGVGTIASTSASVGTTANDGNWALQPGHSVSQSQVQTGLLNDQNLHVILTISSDYTFHAFSTSFGEAFVDGMTASVNPDAWSDIQNRMKSSLGVYVSRLSNQQVKITFPSVSSYDISEIETITFTVPPDTSTMPSEFGLTIDTDFIIVPNDRLSQIPSPTLYYITDTERYYMEWSQPVSALQVVQYQINCRSDRSAPSAWSDDYIDVSPPSSTEFTFTMPEDLQPGSSNHDCRVVAIDIEGAMLTSTPSLARESVDSLPRPIFSVKLRSGDAVWETTTMTVNGDSEVGTYEVVIDTGDGDTEAEDVVREGALLRLFGTNWEDEQIVEVASVSGSTVTVLAALEAEASDGWEVELLTGGGSTAYMTYYEDFGGDVWDDDDFSMGFEGFKVTVDDLDSSELPSSNTLELNRVEDDRFYVLNGLKYGHSYHVELNTQLALNPTDGNGVYDFTFTNTYSEPDKTPPPYLDDETEVGATSMYLRWDPPPNDGGFPVTKYVIKCTRGGSSDTWVVSEDITLADYHGQVLTEGVISGLTSESAYKCQVEAYTEFGSSSGYFQGFGGSTYPPLTTSDADNERLMPPTDLVIEQEGNPDLEVLTFSWSAPADGMSVTADSYQVEWWMSDGGVMVSQGVWECVAGTEFRVCDDGSCQASHTPIAGRYYAFKVAALDESGLAGVVSAEKVVQYHGVAGDGKSIGTCGSYTDLDGVVEDGDPWVWQTEVTLIDSALDGAVFMWEAPCGYSSGGVADPVTKYRVELADTVEAEMESDAAPLEKVYIAVPGLLPSTTYREDDFRLFGFNENDDDSDLNGGEQSDAAAEYYPDNWSTDSLVDAFEDMSPLMMMPPSLSTWWSEEVAEQSLDMMGDGAAMVDVEWEVPASDNGSPIRHYELQYREETRQWQTVSLEEEQAATTATTLSNLHPGLVFHVRVRSCNRQIFHGTNPKCSLWSPSSSIRTVTPEFPSAAAAPTIEDITDSGFWLSFELPSFLGGSALAYNEIECAVSDTFNVESVRTKVGRHEKAPGPVYSSAMFDADVSEYYVGNLPSSGSRLDASTTYYCRLNLKSYFGYVSYGTAVEGTTADAGSNHPLKMLPPIITEVSSATVTAMYHIGGSGNSNSEATSCRLLYRLPSSGGVCPTDENEWEVSDEVREVVADEGTDGQSLVADPTSNIALLTSDITDDGSNMEVCLAVQCAVFSVTVETALWGALSTAVLTSTSAGVPGNVDGDDMAVLDVSDRSVLLQWVEPLTNGAHVEQYTLRCVDDSEETFSSQVAVSDLPLDADGRPILQEYVTGLSPEEGYDCWVVSENSEGTSPDPDSEHFLSVTTSTDSGGADGFRRVPMTLLSPQLAAEGEPVCADETCATTLPRKAVTHQQIKLEWKLPCGATIHSADRQTCCFGSADAEGVDLSDGDDDVEIEGYVLRWRIRSSPFFVTTDDWNYLNTGDVTDTGDTFSNLFGGTTYEFQVAAYNNVESMKSKTFFELRYSISYLVTTFLASPPDKPFPPTADTDEWHTRHAVWVTWPDVGDGYGLLSRNGALISSTVVDCRELKAEDEVTEWGASTTRRGVSTSTGLADTAVDADNTAVVRDAESGTSYECRLTATNSIGSSDTSLYDDGSVATTRDGDEENPVRMRTPLLVEATAATITIEWDPPADDDGVSVIGYTVEELTTGLTLDLLGSETLQWTLDDDALADLELTVQASTTYQFQVSALNRFWYSCDGEPTGVSVASPVLEASTDLVDLTVGQQGSLVMPTLSVVEATASSVWLSWDADVISRGGGDDLSVALQMSTDLFVTAEDVDTPSNANAIQSTFELREMVVPDLPFDTTVQFRLRGTMTPTGASNSITKFSPVLTVVTESLHRPLPPLPDQEGDGRVEAAFDEENGRIQFSFDATYDRGETGSGGTAVYSITIRDDNGDSATADLTGSTVVDTVSLFAGTDFEVLGRNTLYSFDVGYVDTAGQESSTYEDFVSVLSPCGPAPPIPAPAIVSVSKTEIAVQDQSILLEWLPAEMEGGELVSYLVQCVSASSGSFTDLGIVASVEVPWYQTQAAVSGLEPSTGYICRVKGLSSEEELECDTEAGEEADLSDFPTLSEPARAPLMMTPPFLAKCEGDEGETEPPATTRPSPGEVEVAWEDWDLEGRQGSDSLVGYVLAVRQVSSEEGGWVEVDAGLDRSYLATGLQSIRQYQFKVKAYNMDGDGAWSEAMIYPEDEEDVATSSAPDTPSEVVWYGATRSWVMLTWTVKSDGGSVVTGAYIQCKEGAVRNDGTDIWTYETFISTDFLGTTYRSTGGAIHLSEDNVVAVAGEYSCRAKVGSDVGESQWSNAVTGVLPEDPGQPLPLPTPVVTFVNQTSACFYARAEYDDGGSPVRGYEYTLWDGEDGSVLQTVEFGQTAFEWALPSGEELDFEDTDGGSEGVGWERVAEFCVTGLTAGSTYHVTTTAHNRHVFDNGDEDAYVEASEPSLPLSIVTHIGQRPEEPGKVIILETESTSALIQWVPPNDYGNPLTKVEIFCTLEPWVADPSAVAGAESTVACEGEAECAEEWRQTTAMTGLVSGSVYYCHAVASNRWGRSYGETGSGLGSGRMNTPSSDTFPLSIVQAPVAEMLDDATGQSGSEFSFEIQWEGSPGGSDTDLFVVRVWTNGGDTSVDPDDDDDIEEVLLVTVDALDRLTVPTGDQFASEGWELTQLLPQTTYSFQVLAGGSSQWSPIGSITTPSAVPAPPTAPIFIASTQASLLLEWNAAVTRGEAVTMYKVECSADDFETIADSRVLSASVDGQLGYSGSGTKVQGMVDGLEAESGYNCVVAATSWPDDSDEEDVVWSPMSESSKGMVTASGFRTPPLQLFPPLLVDVAGEHDPDSASAAFLAKPNTLKVRFGAEVGQTQYDDGLGGDGDAVKGFIVRHRLVATPPFALALNDLLDGSVGEWEETYIAGEGADGVVEMEAKFWVVTGLYGGSEYEFEVAAVTYASNNVRRVGGFSDPLVVLTPESGQPDVPSQPVIIDVTAESALVYTHADDNGVALWYYYVECRAVNDDGSFTSYDITGRVHASGYGYVGGFDEGVNYRCKSTAVNLLGETSVRPSYDSEVFAMDLYSAPPLPLSTSPPTVVATAADGFVLSLSPVFDDALSTIQYQTLAFDITSTYSSSSYTEIEVARTALISSDNTVVVTGLEGSTTYYFRSRSRNYNSDSVWSVDTVASTSDSDRPADTNRYPLTDDSDGEGDGDDDGKAVASMWAADSVDTGIFFQWDQPFSNGREIFQFKIDCSLKDFESEDFDEDDTITTGVVDAPSILADREWYVDGLTAGTGYHCRISFRNVVGWGNFASNVFTTSTTTDRPLKALMPTVKSASSKSIVLENELGFNWNRASLLQVSVSAVYSGTTLSAVTYVTDAVDEALTVTGLQPLTTYAFSVTVLGDGVLSAGPSSELREGTTAEGVPLFPIYGVTTLRLTLDTEVEVMPDSAHLVGAIGSLFAVPASAISVEAYAGSSVLEVAITSVDEEMDSAVLSALALNHIGNGSVEEALGGVTVITSTVEDNAGDPWIESVTSEAVFVEWYPLVYRGVDVEGVLVRCGEESGDDDGEVTLKSIEENTSVDVTHLGAAVKSLSGGGTYVCEVEFSTSVGTVTSTRTPAYTLPPVGDHQPPLKMAQPWLSDVTSESIEIIWDTPKSSIPQATTVWVRWGLDKYEEHQYEEEVSIAITVLKVRDLLAGKAYRFSIGASNGVGEGDTEGVGKVWWSQPLTVTTDTSSPGTPEPPKYLTSDGSSLTVVLSALNSDGEVVDGGLTLDRFAVVYDSPDRGTFQEPDEFEGRWPVRVVAADGGVALGYQQTLTVDDIADSERVLSFRVALVNGEGQGAWTTAVEIAAEFTPPASPTVVSTSVVNMDDGAGSDEVEDIRVVWVAPTFDGGVPVTSYTVCLDGLSPSYLPSFGVVCTAISASSLEQDENGQFSTTMTAANIPYHRGGTYRCLVGALNEVGEGERDAGEEIVLAAGRPYPPSVTMSSNSSSLTVELTTGFDGGSTVSKVSLQLSGAIDLEPVVYEGPSLMALPTAVYTYTWSNLTESTLYFVYGVVFNELGSALFEGSKSTTSIAEDILNGGIVVGGDGSTDGSSSVDESSFTASPAYRQSPTHVASVLLAAFFLVGHHLWV